MSKQRLSVDGFYLLSEALVIESEQRIVRFVRRATNRIGHQHHTIAKIDCSQHRRKHADIGFGASNDQGVGMALAQQLQQPALNEGRIILNPAVASRRGGYLRPGLQP